MPFMTRGRTFRQVWDHARSPGYKRSPRGLFHAGRDAADTIPGLLSFINVSIGNFSQVGYRYQGRHVKKGRR